MINFFAHSKDKKDSGMEFYFAMVESFAGDLIQNFRTQDIYNIEGIQVRVNQKGQIAFSEKNNELISMIENKTGYKLKCR